MNKQANVQHTDIPTNQDLSADEVAASEKLREYLTKQGQCNIEKNLGELMSLEGGFIERFNFFLPLLASNAKEHILISGSGVGSELIVAFKYGFKRATGTEVIPTLLEIANTRLSQYSQLKCELYDGLHLRYESDSFSMIYSGHVIEHTPNPESYFAEHLRVLKPGGFFFIEFPNRYHRTELHTGQLSCEWLPLPVRNLALKLLSNHITCLPSNKRDLYDLVRRTLKPVSAWQIRAFVRRHGTRKSCVVATQTPAPGFVRLLIRK